MHESGSGPIPFCATQRNISGLRATADWMCQNDALRPLLGVDRPQPPWQIAVTGDPNRTRLFNVYSLPKGI